jgi:four helix bundle protein
MGTPTIHSDLVAWQEAMNLVEIVYRETDEFPRKEVFGLTAQIRRAAISVVSNISEGAARNSRKEFAQFVGFSCGSLAELETQLALCQRLGYLCDEARCISQTAFVGKLVRNLRKALRTDE